MFLFDPKESHRVLVTGATGFVGQALINEMLRHEFSVKGIVRSQEQFISGAEPVLIASMDDKTNWEDTLHNVDVVIHLAARVHVMQDTAADPLTEFRQVNTLGTEQLARSAAASGVKRLVYVSSIKVSGETTHDSNKLTETDLAALQDPYAISKYEAEQALYRVANETGLEVVIVRPPLVYGPGVKGNFAQMLGVVFRGIPLPFASVNNRRSLIYVENLVDALIRCATHSAAAGQTYLVSDGEDISTPDLLRQLAREMAIPSRLFPCAPMWLRLAGKLSGKSLQIDRLLGSLRIDSDKIRTELNWKPPYSLPQGLQMTAQWYKNNHP
jgi:nucleoside-diphosphate-sugar epimerase